MEEGRSFTISDVELLRIRPKDQSRVLGSSYGGREDRERDAISSEAHLQSN